MSICVTGVLKLLQRIKTSVEHELKIVTLKTNRNFHSELKQGFKVRNTVIEHRGVYVKLETLDVRGPKDPTGRK